MEGNFENKKLFEHYDLCKKTNEHFAMFDT